LILARLPKLRAYLSLDQQGIILNTDDDLDRKATSTENDEGVETEVSIYLPEERWRYVLLETMMIYG